MEPKTYLLQESPHKDFWREYDATCGMQAEMQELSPSLVALHSPFLVSGCSGFVAHACPDAPLQEMARLNCGLMHEDQAVARIQHQQRCLAEEPANIWCVERPYRPTYLLAYLNSEVARGVETDLILSLWRDTEAPHYAQETWDEIFAHERFDPASLDRSAIPAGTFPIYRGGDYAGRSWTLDQQIGTWFAHRFGTQRVQTATISGDEVLFYTNGRQEQEVVLNEQGLAEIYGDTYSSYV